MKILFMLVLFAAPVAAQDLVFSPNATEICAAESTDLIVAEACVGRSSDLCMTENGNDGSSTVGMGYCLSRELDYWDARLNIAYKSLRQVDRVYDAELDELGSSAPRRVAVLRDMQRAWIGYRDAACAYEYSGWGGGSGGGPAHASCMMRVTGEQALHLEATLEERQ
ncbi:MAG: DUF1311 domain-containing protein [Boseongicola sp.]